MKYNAIHISRVWKKLSICRGSNDRLIFMFIPKLSLYFHPQWYLPVVDVYRIAGSALHFWIQPDMFVLSILCNFIIK